MRSSSPRVLIFQQRSWGLTLGHALAKRFRDMGCPLAALTLKQECHDFTLRQTDVKYELVLFADEAKFDPSGTLGKDDFRLADICHNLGVDSIWELVQSMRNHVKSYRDKYYYGFRQNLTDEEIILYVKAIYKNIRIIFNRFNPQVIVAPNFVALQHIMFGLYARQRGVPMVVVSDSKIRNLYYFSHDYLERSGPFQDRCDSLNQGAECPNRDRAREYINQFRQHFIAPKAMDDWLASHQKNLTARIKQNLLLGYSCLNFLAKRRWREKNIFGVSVDYRPPYYILRDALAQRRYLRAATRRDYANFRIIPSYAYFPLQFQPEASIDIHASRCNNQIETARQVAMSLPGDLTLVVKDHPAMIDRHPPSYLDKLARTPNVKLVRADESNHEILRKAALVIAPVGTVLAEAAFLGIPAIQLGDLGKTMALPNVVRHTDFSTLGRSILNALDMDVSSPDYERRLENYVAAMYDVGFEMNYAAIWSNPSAPGFETYINRFADEAVAAAQGKTSP